MINTWAHISNYNEWNLVGPSFSILPTIYVSSKAIERSYFQLMI